MFAFEVFIPYDVQKIDERPNGPYVSQPYFS